MKKIVLTLSIAVSSFKLFAYESVINTTSVFNKAIDIEFGHFSVNQIGSKLNFTWITKKEKDNDYFTIEQSYDGLTFMVVTTVNGGGNNENGNYYSVSINSMVNQAYYRLKQTDINGNYSYSNTVQVNTR